MADVPLDGLGVRELRTLIDELPHPMWVRDLRGLWLFTNRAFAAAFGESGPSARDASFFDAGDPGERHRDGPLAHEASLTLDGVETCWLLVHWLLRGADGEPAALAGIATDITRQRQAQRQLHELRARPPAA